LLVIILGIEERRRVDDLGRDRSHPVLAQLLLAPPEDEDITADEDVAVEEARADTAAGRLLALEDVKRDLGL
jgi:hypothetical protein